MTLFVITSHNWRAGAKLSCLLSRQKSRETEGGSLTVVNSLTYWDCYVFISLPTFLYDKFQLYNERLLAPEFAWSLVLQGCVSAITYTHRTNCACFVNHSFCWICRLCFGSGRLLWRQSSNGQCCCYIGAICSSIF